MDKKEQIKELKPCPFCGGDAKIFDMGCDYFVVCCERDTCLGNVSAGEGFYCDSINIPNGIEVWNTRHLSQTSELSDEEIKKILEDYADNHQGEFISKYDFDTLIKDLSRTHHSQPPQLTEDKVVEILTKSVRSTKERTNSRLRQCYYCTENIGKGDKYISHQFRYDKTIFTVGLHIDCAKELTALSGEKGVSNGIKVGSKVIVLGTLHTEIIEIVGDTYYFLDEDGKRWSETLGGIKQVLSGEKGEQK